MAHVRSWSWRLASLTIVGALLSNPAGACDDILRGDSKLELPTTPDTTFSCQADPWIDPDSPYFKPLFGEAFLNFRMDMLYRSYLNLTSSPNVRRTQGFPENSLGSPAHVKVNGRIALKNLDIGGAKTELAVWGRNITNTKYSNSNLFLPTGTAVNYDPARTFGAELSIEF